MKRIFGIMAIVLVVCVLAGYSFGQGKKEKDWSKPQKVNSGRQPIMTIDSKGQLHAVWQNWPAGGGFQEIYYSKFDGTMWSGQLNLSKSQKDTSTDAAIAVDSKDNIHIVFVENNSAIFYTSFDGKTWSKAVAIKTGGISCANRPSGGLLSMVIDSKDNLYVLYRKKPHGICYLKFDSKKWSEPVTIQSSLVREPRMVIDGEGACHIVYDIDGRIKHSVSKDHVKWSKPKTLYVKYKGPSSSLTLRQLSRKRFKSQAQKIRYVLTDGDGAVHVVLDQEETEAIPLRPDPTGNRMGDHRIRTLWNGYIHMKWEGKKWTKAKRHKSYKNIEKIYNEIISGLSKCAPLSYSTCLSEDRIYRIYSERRKTIYYTYKQRPKSRKIKLSSEQLKKVEELVKNLGDDEYKVRKKATEELTGIGEPAIPALKKALKKTKDPEVKERIEKILKELK